MALENYRVVVEYFRRRVVKLYFDSFVYDLIQRRGETNQVRRWRKSNRHEIGVSMPIVVEAARNEDEAERDARLRTILQVGTPIHPPYDYLHYREIADEMWRLRPGWFRQYPDRRLVTAFLRKRKREWAKLKSSPLPDLKEQLSRIYSLVGRDKDRQQRYRDLLRQGIDWFPEHSRPEVQQCINQLPKTEAWWRYVSAEETRPSFDAQLQLNGFLEWLIDFDWPQPLAEYHRFWMCDAEGARVPLCRIVGLAEFFQRQRKVTHGNPFDRVGHAPHLLGFELFVTTDRRFSQVLNDVRAGMSEVRLGRVALIDSEAPSALAAIQEAVVNNSSAPT